MKRAILLCSFLFFSFQLIAEEDGLKRDAYLNQYKVEPMATPETVQDEGVTDGSYYTEQDEADVESIRNRRFKTAQAYENVPLAPGTTQVPVLKPNASMQEIIKTVLAPYQQMTQLEAESILLQKLEEKKADTYVRKYPILLTFMGKMFRDKEAIPSLARIVEQKKKLLVYAGLFFLTLLLSFILRKIGERFQTGRFKWFLFRVTVINILRLGIFVVLFESELSPAWGIFIDTFL